MTLSLLGGTPVRRPHPFAEHGRQCDDVDPDGGRCQLQDRHEPPHAASVGDAYLTWEAGKLNGWSMQIPPSWLFDLRWAPGFGPRVRHRAAR
jgi:hypothetical protein